MKRNKQGDIEEQPKKKRQTKNSNPSSTPINTNSVASTPNITALFPRDLLLHVFSFLPPANVARFGQVRNITLRYLAESEYKE